MITRNVIIERQAVRISGWKLRAVNARNTVFICCIRRVHVQIVSERRHIRVIIARPGAVSDSGARSYFPIKIVGDILGEAAHFVAVFEIAFGRRRAGPGKELNVVYGDVSRPRYSSDSLDYYLQVV